MNLVAIVQTAAAEAIRRSHEDPPSAGSPDPTEVGMGEALDAMGALQHLLPDHRGPF